MTAYETAYVIYSTIHGLLSDVSRPD